MLRQKCNRRAAPRSAARLLLLEESVAGARRRPFWRLPLPRRAGRRFTFRLDDALGDLVAAVGHEVNRELKIVGGRFTVAGHRQARGVELGRDDAERLLLVVEDELCQSRHRARLALYV